MSYLDRKKGKYKPQMREIQFDFGEGAGLETIPLIPISYATRQRIFTSRLKKNGNDAKGNPLYSIDITGDARNMNAEVICATVADENGKPAYELADLQEWESDVIEKLYKAISEKCNLFSGTDVDSESPGDEPENPPTGQTS